MFPSVGSYTTRRYSSLPNCFARRRGRFPGRSDLLCYFDNVSCRAIAKLMKGNRTLFSKTENQRSDSLTVRVYGLGVSAAHCGCRIRLLPCTCGTSSSSSFTNHILLQCCYVLYVNKHSTRARTRSRRQGRTRRRPVVETQHSSLLRIKSSTSCLPSWRKKQLCDCRHFRP